MDRTDENGKWDVGYLFKLVNKTNEAEDGRELRIEYDAVFGLSLVDMIRIGEQCVEEHEKNSQYFASTPFTKAILHTVCKEDDDLREYFEDCLNDAKDTDVAWILHALYAYENGDIKEALKHYYRDDMQEKSDLDKLFLNTWGKLGDGGSMTLLCEYLKLK